ncbi:hypothetical protein BTH42_02195 [Burkholderia sp. SRS-W-2-2016]|nr:hypothetical protein BTH42_02195 [Burkholderia sp. SRS-W-2-2016]
MTYAATRSAEALSEAPYWRTIEMEANDPHSAAPPTDDEVERVVRAGPGGAIALAGVATVIVMAIWFAFYFFAFLPRGIIH